LILLPESHSGSHIGPYSASPWLLHTPHLSRFVAPDFLFDFRNLPPLSPRGAVLVCHVRSKEANPCPRLGRTGENCWFQDMSPRFFAAFFHPSSFFPGTSPLTGAGPSFPPVVICRSLLRFFQPRAYPAKQVLQGRMVGSRIRHCCCNMFPLVFS